MENAFHETYKRLTPDTKAHADVFNTIFDQLFQNDSLLKEGQEIEYITEGSILELCEKKKKSFRFIAYSYVDRSYSKLVMDMPNYGNDENNNFWHGEFKWLLPMYENNRTRPMGIHCILRVKNLSGEEYVTTGWEIDDIEDRLRIVWDKWIQTNGYSIVYNKDVHDLSSGRYFIIGGTNLPNRLMYTYVEVTKNDYIEEILCRDGANIYIKKRNPHAEWGEWKCLSSDKTMPVYVGSTPPEDTNVLWVW